METLENIPPDTGLVRGGNGGDGQPKPKARLLSLADLDRRTNAYKKTVETIDRVEADCGGADMLSTAERSIIRHAALTGAMIEDLGARWLAGEPIDPALFATLSNAERRLYETIGIKRRAREIIPDPLEYAHEHALASEDGS